MTVTTRVIKGMAALAGLLSVAMPHAAFADPSGELVILNWLGGSELATMQKIEAGFMAKYPAVKIRELPVTSASSDPTGAIRTMIVGGEKIDLMMSAWPSIRREFIQDGLLRPLDDAWTKGNWSADLSDAWKKVGQEDGATYGITYTYGDRTGIWYRPDVLAKAGISSPPKTWDEFLASFKKLKAAGITPLEIPAKVWAQQEIFQSILSRVGGSDAVDKLGKHQIAWTDPVVKTALQKYVELLKSDCCGSVNTMLATEWDQSADNVLKAGTSAYLNLGMWVNNRAIEEYKLKEGVDYSLFQWPAMGMGHDQATQVDAKEYFGFKNGPNPEAADAFLGYLISPEACNIIAASGFPSTCTNVDTSVYGPVTKTSTEAESAPGAEVSLVVGDQFPGDVSDEYHLQLQKLIQDPSDATIDSATNAIEAKAKDAY